MRPGSSLPRFGSRTSRREGEVTEMQSFGKAERIETVIVGAGQAGLAVGYHLRRRGRPFLILEGSDRVGGSWRNRWDSLRLFTPAKYDGLPGMRFPAARWD